MNFYSLFFYSKSWYCAWICCYQSYSFRCNGSFQRMFYHSFLVFSFFSLCCVFERNQSVTVECDVDIWYVSIFLLFISFNTNSVNLFPLFGHHSFESFQSLFSAFYIQQAAHFIILAADWFTRRKIIFAQYATFNCCSFN